MFEKEETKKAELIKALEKGENSGFIENFNRKQFISNLHNTHLKDDL